MGTPPPTPPLPRLGPSLVQEIIPNDLWGIHDILYVGFSAVFMEPGSKGKAEVQKRAVDLTNLLPFLPPHEPCRASLKVALSNVSLPAKERIRAAGSAAWSCLPVGSGWPSFEDAFENNG